MQYMFGEKENRSDSFFNVYLLNYHTKKGASVHPADMLCIKTLGLAIMECDIHSSVVENSALSSIKSVNGFFCLL